MKKSGGLQCANCGSRSFHKDDETGFYICRDCSTQSQDYQQEESEWQGRANKIGKTEKTKKVAVVREVEPDLTPEEYLLSFQFVLRQQVAWLIEAKRCSPKLVDVARQVWLSYVANGKGLPVAAAVRAELAEPEAPVEAVVAEGELPPFQLTLAICLVGCWQLREPVSMEDIITWVHEGHLPYLWAYRLLPARSLLGKVGNLLKPKAIPAPRGLFTYCKNLCKQCGIDVPPVNLPLALRRLLRDLLLPATLLGPVLNLAALCDVHLGTRGMSTEFDFGGLDNRAPMALIVVALGLCYGLHDDDPVAAVDGLPPRDEWLQRVRAKQEDHVPPIPWSPEDALRLGPDELTAYLEFCRTQVFADPSWDSGRDKPFDNSVLVSMLAPLAAPAPAAPLAEEVDAPDLEPLEYPPEQLVRAALPEGVNPPASRYVLYKRKSPYAEDLHRAYTNVLDVCAQAIGADPKWLYHAVAYVERAILATMRRGGTLASWTGAPA